MNSSVASSAEPAARFAYDVASRLQKQGFCAFWAGGCVRDQLLGKRPKDYDVATNATPEQVRAALRGFRSQLVGAAFGVVAVSGPREAGTIEVATFRRDEGYSDGRHPDRVVFSSPEEDAQRRDFTINGLFYDPLRDQIHDFVGGREDLTLRMIRCIGQPAERFHEDKLRMLRAIRFTTTLEFEIDAATLAAIVTHSNQLNQVSAERVGMEVRKILQHSARARGFELLVRSTLWTTMMPDHPVDDVAGGAEKRELNQRILDGLAWLPDDAEAPLAVATLFEPLLRLRSWTPNLTDQIAQLVMDRWRWTNRECDEIAWLLKHTQSFYHAERRPWPEVQRLLIEPHAKSLLKLSRASLMAEGGNDANLQSLQWCDEKLRLPPEELNPPMLLNGHDLVRLGAKPGPGLGQLLKTVRDAQLVGGVHTHEDALHFARQMLSRSASETH